jgi:hypothetical protein
VSQKEEIIQGLMREADEREVDEIVARVQALMIMEEEQTQTQVDELMMQVVEARLEADEERRKGEEL